MRVHLRAGAAVFNEGRYHAAHDAWEERWLALDDGDDERLLHGLIQFTAVVHHATEGNDPGAAGLADSAGDYLADLPADYRGVALDPVRAFLDDAADDPGVVRREGAPALRHEGTAPDYDDLGFEATAVVAAVLAEADGYDTAAVERAVDYARAELPEGGTFVGLLFSFVRETDARGVVVARLTDHVARRRARDRDVDALFD